MKDSAISKFFEKSRKERLCQLKVPRQLRSVASEAKRLGVSKGWLYGEVRAGRFPHVRLGTRVLLSPADVDRFLALREVSVEDALAHAEDNLLH